ncbi:hypothetical protein IQ246_17320 [aff. Roholtiella sp. LEGE 12411]|nr:hypothetical protein [aff. Roholtiella sp. LEGE 12411]
MLSEESRVNIYSPCATLPNAQCPMPLSPYLEFLCVSPNLVTFDLLNTPSF